MTKGEIDRRSPRSRRSAIIRRGRALLDGGVVVFDGLRQAVERISNSSPIDRGLPTFVERLLQSFGPFVV